MSDNYSLLRALIREEMEYYGKHMGQGSQSLGSGSGAEVEIDAWMEELQTIEGQIQQIQSTPKRMYGSGDTKKLDDLNDRKSEIEFQIQSLQDVL